MVIWILTVKSHRYHPNRRFLEASALLRHKAFLIHPGKLSFRITDRECFMDGLLRYPRPDVILPRIGATIKEYGLTAIRHFQLMGIPVMNRFEALLLASNKFLSIQTLAAAGIPVPETCYASNWPNFGTALASLGGFPVVVKIAKSRQGSGVFMFDSLEKATPVLNNELDRGQGLLLQRYIPLEKRGDFRVFVVGEEVVGAMSLRPPKGDFRSNIHLGGKAEQVKLSNEMSGLAVRSARVLGLDVAGVDMVQEGERLFVIEVNSSPGFKGLERCTGKDIAAAVVRFATKTRGKGHENSIRHGQAGFH